MEILKIKNDYIEIDMNEKKNTFYIDDRIMFSDNYITLNISKFENSENILNYFYNKKLKNEEIILRFFPYEKSRFFETNKEDMSIYNLELVNITTISTKHFHDTYVFYKQFGKELDSLNITYLLKINKVEYINFRKFKIDNFLNSI